MVHAVFGSDGKYTVGTVSTIETLGEFVTYAKALEPAGYFLPKNWVWKV